jgi:hypothetical protein
LRRWRRKWAIGTLRSRRRSCIFGSRWRSKANPFRSSWRSWGWRRWRSCRRWKRSNNNRERRTLRKDQWAGYSWCKERYVPINKLKKRAYNIIKKLQSYGFSSWLRKSLWGKKYIIRGRRAVPYMSSFSQAGWARWEMSKVDRETSSWR